MALSGRMSPTRGTLVRLRTSLEFIQNGLSVLKLKRDRLAEELNLLLKEIGRRDKAEEQLMEVFEDFKTSLAMLGFQRVYSEAHSVGKMKVSVTERSVMNVIVPEVRIEEKSSADIIRDASLYRVAVNSGTLINDWLDIACVEASTERISYELTLVNRKINAIEKVVIPTYQTQVKYIEDYLADEELEDFTRIKHVKTASREKES